MNVGLCPEPPEDCERCQRLVAFRARNRAQEPTWFNAPVPSFGDARGRLAIVGLAPGLKGANRTGRPFTGDHAGDLLYATLLKFDFATGSYLARPDDGFTLTDCLVTNAVRCVPPKNKPQADEAKHCQRFLVDRLKTMPNLRAVLALGRIAHDNVVACHGFTRSHFKFGHSATHQLSETLQLFDSYHCSRYNTNTRRLTETMFQDVFQSIRLFLDRPADE